MNPEEEEHRFTPITFENGVQVGGPRKTERNGIPNEVFEKIKSGYYLQKARENPMPDRYDEYGRLIPPGCFAVLPKTKHPAFSTDPEVLDKAKSGAYLELAKYKRERNEKKE